MQAGILTHTIPPVVLRFRLFWVALTCTFACALACAQETAKITILHVNDSHGQTLGQRGDDGKMRGGYPRLATAVRQIRDELGSDRVILLHAGDEFSRGDAMTSATLGAANITIMNAIAFAAWTPGNGEFYGGASNLQQRIAEAKFPTLAANVSYRLDGQKFSDESTLLTVQNVRIGIFGLCFVRKEHPSALPLKVEEPAAAAGRVVPDLRRKCDIVVALDHLGLEQDRQLAAAVPGIDLIVGGHSHTTLPRGHRVQGPDGQSVLIAQAGEYLQWLGRVDLTLTRTDGSWKLTQSDASLIPLNSTVPEDPTVKALIARLWPATRPATAPVNSAAAH